jgi:hypothetical protein
MKDDNIKMYANLTGVYVVDVIGMSGNSKHVSVVYCCKHGNRTVDFIKDGEFLVQTSDYQLFKKGPAPLTYFIIQEQDHSD